MQEETASRARSPKPPPHRVAVLAYDGLSLFEFSVACDVFAPAEGRALGTDWYRLDVCGEAEKIQLDNGLQLTVPARLAALGRADTVIVPPCTDPSSVSAATLAAIRRAHARGARIVALCTGALVLARTGLLDGRRAVTHWADCDAFATDYPAITVDPTVLYVDDGDILTSAGSAASIDLCLYLVRLDHAAEIAGRLARRLVVAPHREGGQAQYIDRPMPDPVRDQPLTATLDWMNAHLSEPVTVSDLAARSTMSPRSFVRHFAAVTGTTPHQWLLRQRVLLAQQLLEHSDLAIDAVATQSGLGDATNLRKHFRRQVGTSPAAYRSTFQPRSEERSRWLTSR